MISLDIEETFDTVWNKVLVLEVPTDPLMNIIVKVDVPLVRKRTIELSGSLLSQTYTVTPKI